MKSAAPTPATIAAYIAAFPPDVRRRLQQIRRIVRNAAPGATETIKYRLPTFVLEGNLVHFGAFKAHIGFYATPTGNAAFRRELAAYAGGKGSIQFPHDQPLPLDLIRRIVEFRVQETGRGAQTPQAAVTSRRPFR